MRETGANLERSGAGPRSTGPQFQVAVALHDGGYGSAPVTLRSWVGR
jgi:hypothetical protein